MLSRYPDKHGGIRPTQHIARIAEAASLPCTIGSNLEREVATATFASGLLCDPPMSRITANVIRRFLA